MIDAADGIAAFRSYASLIQMRLTDALCKSPLTRPDAYRLVAQMRFDQPGTVIASKLVSSAGTSFVRPIRQAGSSCRGPKGPVPGLRKLQFRTIALLMHAKSRERRHTQRA